jgi:hypothetical protein
MSQSNPGPASQGLPNSVAAIGQTISRGFYPGVGITALTAPAQGSLSLQYFGNDWPVSASRMDLLLSMNFATSATANTGAFVFSASAGIYSNQSGTLTLLSGGQNTWSWSYASNNSGSTQLTAAAIRPISVPMNVMLYPGEYIAAFAISTNTLSVGTATTALGATYSVMGWNSNQSAANYAEWTAATNASFGLEQLGIYTSTVASLPITINALSSIQNTGAKQSAAQFAFVLRNY